MPGFCLRLTLLSLVVESFVWSCSYIPVSKTGGRSVTLPINPQRGRLWKSCFADTNPKERRNALRASRRLSVVPSLPFPARRVAGGCGSCRGEAGAEAVAQPRPCRCLVSLPSPLLPANRGFGAFSPLHQWLVPAQDALLLATAVVSLLRSWPLPCKSWLQRPYRALSYIHNCKTLNDFKNAKGSGCARLVGRWQVAMVILSWGKGIGYQRRTCGVMGSACTFISCSTKHKMTLTLMWAPGHACNVNINTEEAILLS